jgi:hypothetical protein
MPGDGPMKKLVWIAVLLVVLVLDWAALHDILLGSEPDYFLEWTWLVGSTLVLAGAAWVGMRRRRSGRSSR